MLKITYAVAFVFLAGVFLTSSSMEAREEFPVSPPPFTEGIYPCSNCHASMELNRKLLVSFGIWAMGFLIFTLLIKVAIPIASGEFSHSKYEKGATTL